MVDVYLNDNEDDRMRCGYPFHGSLWKNEQGEFVISARLMKISG